MSVNTKNLLNLAIGESAIVEDLIQDGDLYYRQRLLAQGVVPGVILQVIKVAPFGDPIEVTVPSCGNSFVVRAKEAKIIKISKI